MTILRTSGTRTPKMGLSLTTLRDDAFRPFAFPAPPPTYTENHPGILMIEGDESEIPVLWNNVTRTSGKTIIYSHGNGCDLGSSYVVFDALKPIGVNIISYDYPGYGIHKGIPSQTTCYNTIKSVYEYVISTGVRSSDIVLMGQSIGTGPTTWLASQLPDSEISAVILISPYTSAIGVVSPSSATVTRSSMYIFGGSMDIFDNYTNIQRIECPVKVIHGLSDSLINSDHGLALYGISPNPMPFGSIAGAGHNDLWSTYRHSVIAEIESVVQKSKFFQGFNGYSV